MKGCITIIWPLTITSIWIVAYGLQSPINVIIVWHEHMMNFLINQRHPTNQSHCSNRCNLCVWHGLAFNQSIQCPPLFSIQTNASEGQNNFHRCSALTSCCCSGTSNLTTCCLMLGVMSSYQVISIIIMINHQYSQYYHLYQILGCARGWRSLTELTSTET